MWWSNPIPKEVRAVVDALKNLPKSAKNLGGAEGLCRAFAGLVDHTLLKPEAKPDEIRRICEEAVKYGFATVFVNPCYTALAAKRLKGSDVRVGSVAGFPLGASSAAIKLAEAKQGIEDGAHEVDMVICVGALKAGEDKRVESEIRELAEACHEGEAILKVILECALLTDEEKRRGAKLALRAGADFVKTSTGFAAGGATVADVQLMRRTVGPGMGVKAAGGVRTRDEAEAMVQAGATRIGASAGVKITQAEPASRPGAAVATAGLAAPKQGNY